MNFSDFTDIHVVAQKRRAAGQCVPVSAFDSCINNAKQLIKDESDLSPALRSALQVLLLLVSVLLNRVTLNSKNSSKPPCADPNRLQSSRTPSKRPSGAQKGHVGATLEKVSDPDVVTPIKVDQRTLPRGHYQDAGIETRQVFDVDISRVVTEYQAHAVYLSQYQLLPYKRIQQYFSDQLSIPLSEGSLINFNRQASSQLVEFEQIAKDQLTQVDVAHADETGININGGWTHYFPHAKRGMEAMIEAGILPRFRGVLCHDHWKPYYRFDFTHALCNAHHLRELTRAWEQDGQVWAKEMETLLKTINRAVDEQGGVLDQEPEQHFRQQYRSLLATAQKECPAPQRPPGKRKRGRLKRSKARNLLERLIDYEADVLRFNCRTRGAVY